MQYLAAIPSLLLSASSATDACISALESSISALESSLKVAENASPHWEHIAIAASLVVVLGIFGEWTVIASEDCDDRHDWARGIVRPPDRAPRWRFWLDFIATGVVIVGILGETWASLELASINSNLRSMTEKLRADSDQLVALVTQQAGSAAQSALEAQAAARSADVDAGSAQSKADAVSRLAARIDWQLRLMQYLLSAREVQDSAGLTKELSQFHGQTVILTSYIGDVEGGNLCTQIWYAAHNAKMFPVDKCGQSGLTPQLIIPLTVFGPDLDEAVKIGQFLSQHGVGVVSGVKNPSLTIFVGSKGPIPLVPNDQTRDVEKRAAAAKKAAPHKRP